MNSLRLASHQQKLTNNQMGIQNGSMQPNDPQISNNSQSLGQSPIPFNENNNVQ